MRFTLTLIVFLLAAVAIALFATQNPLEVSVRFIQWEVQTSLTLVIVAAAAAGGLLIGVINLYGHLLSKLRHREATSRIRRLEMEHDEVTLDNERLRLELETLEESLKQLTSGDVTSSEGERESDRSSSPGEYLPPMTGPYRA